MEEEADVQRVFLILVHAVDEEGEARGCSRLLGMMMMKGDRE